MRSLFVFSSMLAVMFVATVATAARADECNQLTYFTFSAPVALPGVVLPAGTYQFSHPFCTDNDHLLRVTSRDGSRVFGTYLAIPDERLTPASKPVVVLGESAGPEPIEAWFYPGRTIGDELIYPKAAPRIARQSPTTDSGSARASDGSRS